MILSIVRIIVANQTVGVSDRLHKLDIEIQKYKADNEIQAENLRQLESLQNVSMSVSRLGFVPKKNFSFLKTNESVALVGQLNSF